MTEADEMLTGVGELLFSLLIGYLGALEFAFVARHLYHWTCRHPASEADLDAAADAQELPRLRERLEREYEEAAAREAAAGSNVMQDGVLYSNGFRVESPEEKHRQLEEELARQRRIEEETREQLAQAEQRLEEERRKAEQEAKVAAEAAVVEAAESARKLIEAEKQREAEQRQREQQEEEEARQLQEKAEEREREENERKLLEAEKQREQNERQRQQQEEEKEKEEEERKQREQQENERQQREQAEREENERKLREAERQRELAQAEVERQLLQPDADEEEVQAKRDAEIVERLLAAERERERNLSATESELEEEAVALEQSRRLAASKVNLERKQRSIEENARIFMEAEEEMVALQQRMLEQAREEEATIYAGCVPVVEEPCIKKICPPRFEEPCEEPLVVQRVKTQFGQASGGAEVKSKTLMFPGVSDEGSSLEPISSPQSSFSTQPSEEQRPEPEGEDNVPDVQYTEDYLRSLDGIKSRPLVREDGSGRRRAFKKRRSSGSSNSSRDSRASRDEEVKMFTSLEEEELRHGEKADYNPIKYSTEPTTLRVKSHHRRHKRSPAKDVKHTDSSGSLEMLGEESTNPWGEVVPEHYKDTEFWKREKALSIDEEVLDLGKLAAGEDVQQEEEEEEELSKNKPNASSFEEATEAQNAQAASALQQQRSKEQLDKDSSESAKAPESSASDIKSNLQTSNATEEQPRRGSPGLRRSPRVEEMDHYEERWRETEAAQQAASQPPSISIHQPDTAPWRDQYGLMMEGLSDFYDFTASTNPSRSRPSSRNSSPQPKPVANLMDVDEEHTLEVYDDTQEGPAVGELKCEQVLQLLEVTMNGNEAHVEQLPLQNVADDVKMGNGDHQVVSMVYEAVEEGRRSRSRSRSQPHTVNELEQRIQQKDQLMEGSSNERASSPMHRPCSPMELECSEEIQRNPLQKEASLPQPVIEINAMLDEQMEPPEPEPVPTREEMRLFVETLRAERNSRSRSQSRSRSRSRSPLPTSDNIARSLEMRRLKRIQQNDELAEKLHDEQRHNEESPPAVPPAVVVVPAPALPTPPLPMPTISIEIVEDPAAPVEQKEQPEPEDTPESMARLFEQLRLNRCRSHSRSRSRSPLPSAANLEHSLQQRREKLIAQNDAFFERLEERGRTPEPEVRVIVQHVYEFEESQEEVQRASSREARSLSPSRSRSHSHSHSRSRSCSRSRSLDSEQEHAELAEAEQTEDLESVLANSAKQRELDLEALHQLNTASEEIELRVLSPEDYERTFSEAARELKDEILVSGFKRSTYVGESLDLGSSEYAQQRRECAEFRRSRSPSPSLNLDVSREQAATQRELQAAILNSLVTASGVAAAEQENRLGARPKTSEYERSPGEQATTAGITAQLDDLRHRTAEFQRSRSQSRSPVRDEADALALKNIEAEVAKRELQDQLLDQLAASSVNFENFSRYLNADFLDSERRASDSALILLDPYAEMEPDEYHHFRRYSLAQEQPVEEYPGDECVYISQIEVRSLTGKRTWLKEDFYTRDLDGLELSLEEEEKEQSSESLDESPLISEGSWARAVLAAEAEAAEFDETSAIYNYDILREYQMNDDLSSNSNSNDSDDERQTVVEMDDDDEFEFEVDEGISDNNERTQPTDESHHDTSECEEAERNADRYANRGANDWEEIDNAEDLADYGIDDGAVGGAYSDPDSFIEQIYNDAVKNRKQSGILRDYETMIQEQLTAENADQSESEKEKSSSDSERYALWAKTRELDRSEEVGSRHHREIDVSLGLLESERRDHEMRYLGDAQVAARQSTRLRTRYGYSPKLQVDVPEDDIEVDLNYKPKKEYNWRKNFKLDDGEQQDVVVYEEASQTEEEAQELQVDEEQAQELELDQPFDDVEPLGQPLDQRRISLGGESITLFSRSPVREVLSDVPEETLPEQENAEAMGAPLQTEEEPLNESPKKKKSKKKSRKGSKTKEELLDDNDSDGQPYRRRSSVGQEDVEGVSDVPKRKVRSRRSSKSSTTNEEVNGGFFSPRSSIAYVGDALEGIAEQEPTEETSLKKKTKKRKKLSKESREQSLAEPGEESVMDKALAAALAEIAPISVSVSASANLTPDSTQQNLLSSISAGQSVCLTPASSIEEPASPPPSMPSNQVATPARSVVDTFDILKDANFYPLF